MAADLGWSIRAAVHTGEVELAGADLHGLTVHEAARMLAVAAPGRLVSGTTRALAQDTSLHFEDRGELSCAVLKVPAACRPSAGREPA